jgi:tetratricopeptide (TPR) repeat protein
MSSREEMLDEIRDRALQASKAGHYAAVIELFSAYLQYRPSDTTSWIHLGAALTAFGLKDEAEHALMTAHEQEPDNAFIYARLGMLYADVGHREESERWFSRACDDEEFGKRGWVWILRGANLAVTNQLSAAEQCHRHALMCNDHVDRDEAFLNLGYVLRAKGQYAEAAEAFRAALAITSDDPDASKALNQLVGVEDAIARANQLKVAHNPD